MAPSRTISAWAGPRRRARSSRHAARAANIHGFIERCRRATPPSSARSGIRLSGGQRQRLAIARALLRDAPILVLDEALSAVDAENEAMIQEAIDRLMQGRTTLDLAHRLSSVIDCDRILVLEDGRVVESGSHDALMARRRLSRADGGAGREAQDAAAARRRRRTSRRRGGGNAAAR